MSWCMQKGKGVAAEVYLFVFREIMSHRGFPFLQMDTKQVTALLVQVFYQERILTHRLYFQAKRLIDGMIAPVVVKVSVGSQQMNGFQSIVFDIVTDSIAFFWIIRSTVDDATCYT